MFMLTLVHSAFRYSFWS